MNILIVTERIGERSGWERYSMDMISALSAKGHTVFVVCSEKNPAQSVMQYACLPNAISFKKTYFFSAGYVRKALAFIREQKIAIDRVHCFVEPYSRIAQQISHTLQVPYFITAHGSYAVRPFLQNVLGLPVFGYFQKKAYRQATALICISAYTRQQVLCYVQGIHPVVINNGVNISGRAISGRTSVSFGHRSSEHAPPHTLSHVPSHSQPLLLSVGALKERKGYEYILHALPDIIKKIPDLIYVIVGSQGDVQYVEKLRSIVAEYRMEKHVHFKQKISDDELDGLYRKANVFILTPVSTPASFEGFGLVYLEANAYGVPAVGSFGNGGEDAIQDGQTGLLTQPKNPADIAEKTLRLMTMPTAEYARFSANARAWAEGKSWNLVINQYTDLYENSHPVR